MGIDEDIRAANTTEVGMRFVKDDGTAAASFPIDSSGRFEVRLPNWRFFAESCPAF